MLRFSGAGVSDVGSVRPHNEDSAFTGPYVALVADGVGGAAAGEVASATTAYVVSATALARFGEDPAVVLRDAVALARESLRAGVDAEEQRAGMATTLSAVVCDGERFTYAEICGRARRLVGALRALGLQGGDRVAVIGPNCHRYLELYLGVPAGGFVLVPLNARHTEHELRYALIVPGGAPGPWIST